MLKTSITEPASGNTAHVDVNRALLVETRPVPPAGAPLDALVFREFLRDISGSNDMTVLASPAAPILFSVSAVQNADVYVKSMSFAIGGVSMTLGDFGPIPALTNPCIFLYQTESAVVTLADDITTNFDLMRLGGELMPGVGGTVADALKVGAPVLGMATVDTYVAFVDFARVFGFPWGLRLERGTQQTLGLIIQDDLTAVDAFTCEVYGFGRTGNTEK